MASAYGQIALGTLQYDVAPIALIAASAVGFYWWFTSHMNIGNSQVLQFTRCTECFKTAKEDWNNATFVGGGNYSNYLEAYAAKRACDCYAKYGCKYENVPGYQNPVRNMEGWCSSVCGQTQQYIPSACGQFDLSKVTTNVTLQSALLNACGTCLDSAGVGYYAPLSDGSHDAQCLQCSPGYEGLLPQFQDCCSCAVLGQLDASAVTQNPACLAAKDKDGTPNYVCSKL